VSIIFARVRKGVDPGDVAGRIEDAYVAVDAVARKDIGKSILMTLGDLNRVFIVTVSLAAVLSVFLVWAVFSAIANERSWEIDNARLSPGGHISTIFYGVCRLLGDRCHRVAAERRFHLLAKLYFAEECSVDLHNIERTIISIGKFLAGAGICVVGALGSGTGWKRWRLFWQYGRNK
jgi:putative ABC transport system permease protein